MPGGQPLATCVLAMRNPITLGSWFQVEHPMAAIVRAGEAHLLDDAVNKGCQWPCPIIGAHAAADHFPVLGPGVGLEREAWACNVVQTWNHEQQKCTHPCPDV